jgi:hypothetical protein
MKKLLSTIALCVVMSPAAAVDLTGEDCPTMGELAGKFMEVRQDGWSVTKTLSFASNDYFESLVFRAYEEHRWSSDERRQEAVEDFTIEVELECYSQ